MKFLRLYVRVLELLGSEARMGWMLAVANLALATAHVRGADPVRAHRRSAGERPGARLRMAWIRPDGAGRRLGRLRPVHHRVQHPGRAPRRPPCSPPISGGAHHVLRARAAAAAQLLHRLAFRAAGEGDDDRHQHAVGLVARILPRALRQPGIARRAAADDAVHQLALRPAADRAVRDLRGVDRARGRAAARSCRATSRTTIPTSPSAPPTRSETSPWCRASPASRWKSRA